MNSPYSTPPPPKAATGPGVSNYDEYRGGGAMPRTEILRQ